MLFIIFSVLTLVGLAMSFGLDLVDAILVSISSIDGVRLWIPVLMAFLGVLMAALLINWSIKTEKDRMVPLRVLSVCAIVFYFVVVAVLLSSLWADLWLLRFREWMFINAITINTVNLIGYALLIYLAGWFSCTLYNKKFSPKKRKALGEGTGAHVSGKRS